MCWTCLGPFSVIHPQPQSGFSSRLGLVLIVVRMIEVSQARPWSRKDHQPAGPSLPTALRGLTLTTLSTLMAEFRKQFSLRNEQMASTALFT